MSKDIRLAKTVAEVQQAANSLPQRLLTTGVYKSVALSSTASATVPGGMDLIVDLDENTFAINTSATQAISGSLSTAAEVSLFNLFGNAETVSARVGSATGEIALGGFTDFFNSASSSAVPSLRTDTAAAAVARTAEMLSTPTFLVELRKPTIGDARTPLQVRLRKEVEYHDVTSGFRNRVLEAEAAITDPSNTHSISYGCSWRNLVPIISPNKLYSTGSSPEIIANCDSSLKSSIAYSYAQSSLNAGKTASVGNKLVFRTELAGAGGDVQFLRTAFNGLWAMSFLRFAPDTGYALPKHKAAFVAAVGDTGATASASAAATVESDTEENKFLYPHPGVPLLSLWGRTLQGQLRKTDPPVLITQNPVLNSPHKQHHSSSGERADQFVNPFDTTHPRFTSSSSPTEYTLQHRLAGWLAPGITTHFDLSLGMLLPYGTNAQRPYGTRVVDRFFMLGSRFRGYDSIGPKATTVETGTANGDVLGGDYLAALNTRILLPPPLPSVRLANAGVRSQLFFSVGTLASGKDTTSLGSFLSRSSASAGVGIYLPLVGGTALEANWGLWHKAQQTDVAAKFRFQLTM